MKKILLIFALAISGCFSEKKMAAYLKREGYIKYEKLPTTTWVSASIFNSVLTKENTINIDTTFGFKIDTLKFHK